MSSFKQLLSGRRVIPGLTGGELSGVDVLCAHLLRGLLRREIPANLLLSRPQRVWNPLPTAEDLPIVKLEERRNEPWGERWRRMQTYLEAQASCIYVPNYDYDYSCVIPRLSAGVHVVGIVHSDDESHYDHVARVGRFWDAAVAVSRTIAAETARLCPRLENRLTTIPYGVQIPATLPDRPPHDKLRVVFAGAVGPRRVRWSLARACG